MCKYIRIETWHCITQSGWLAYTHLLAGKDMLPHLAHSFVFSQKEREFKMEAMYLVSMYKIRAYLCVSENEIFQDYMVKPIHYNSS